MKTFTFLCLLTLQVFSASKPTPTSTPSPSKKLHNNVNGLLPPFAAEGKKNQGSGNNDASKPPPTPAAAPAPGHYIDRRFPRKIQDTEKKLFFPAEEKSEQDTRPCSKKYSGTKLFQSLAGTEPQSARDGGVYFLSSPLDTATGPQLYYQASANSLPKPVTDFSNGISFFRVSPDGRKVLLASDLIDEQRIYLYEPSSHSIKLMLSHQRVESVAWSNDSSWFAYTSNARNQKDVDLYRSGVSSGRGTLLANLQGFHLVTDISPDGNAIALTQFRSFTDSDTLVWTAHSIDNITHSGTPAVAGASKFTKDSHSLIALSDAASGFAQLVLFSLGSQKPPKRLSTENDEIDGFALNDTRDALVYITNEKGYSKLHAWRINPQGSQTALLNVPKSEKRVLSIPSFSSSGFFYSRSASTLPWTVWFWNDSTDQSWSPNVEDRIPRQCFVEDEPVSYPSFDGKQIPAFLYRPHVPSTTPVYVVIAHDGPSFQFRPSFQPLVQFFIQRGYGVLAPNVRGSAGYGHRFLDLDNFKNRENAVKDLIAGAQWLLNQQIGRSGNLAVYGEGYGGYLALRALELNPDIFAVGAATSAILDLSLFPQRILPLSKTLVEQEFGFRNEVDFLKTISPISHAGDIKRPILIFASELDKTTLYKEWQSFCNEVKKHSKECEIRKLTGISAFLKNRLGIDGASALAFFFDKALKVSPPE